MAEYPGLVIWTDAYLADTTHLTAEEHGVYLLLLMAAWRSPTCALPDDDERLCRMARVGIKKWRRIRPVMEKLWIIDDRGWTQKRLLAERKRSATFKSRQSKAGKASALKRKETGSTNVPTKEATKFNLDTPIHQSPYRYTDTVSTDLPVGPPQPVTNRTGTKKNSNPGIGSIGSEAFDGPPPNTPPPKHGNGTRPPMSQQQADEYACGLLAQHVPGEWETVLAAEDPSDPAHDKAVTLCLKAAKAHGIGWISPEHRKAKRA